MSSNKGLFSKYPNPVFVETGTWHGDGVQQAIDEGFTKIYSIELSIDLYKMCCERFKDIPTVTLIQGDSHLVLDNLLNTIDEPITFWLDGHFSGDDTVMGKYNSPLMQELNAIERHKIKTHTILIDDLRCWNMGDHRFDEESLRKKLLKINPQYKLLLEDGTVTDDILVAKI
jgi:hypothetical protein